MSLSSTTSTREPSRSRRGRTAAPRTPRLAVKLKQVPFPTTLVTEISPPCNSTRRLTIERPRPVPPYFRVVEESACAKLEKMTPSLSLGIPMPVSLTEKRSTTCGSRSEEHTSELQSPVHL